ncbi:SIR2 family protein [Sphingomonas sp.]|jgi:tetratricopeptide (TPR) repeat protein|uniref:SIR2 family protein n=1 Tax=Sphingomonas sp. TaxID=28214 RepID=UPI0026054202|nr:SIR2 family protein [Sphingomonas sp.]MDF2493285.1 hypothetical protein [Sphingomonas sp.]
MGDLGFETFNARDLRERLTGGVRKSGREVVFLVGSALTAPSVAGAPGVPGVGGVIDLIKREFDEDQQVELRAECAAAENPYQAAFQFLLRRRGQQEVNGVIRQAVAHARVIPADGPATPYEIGASTPEEVCRLFDADVTGWHLAPGVDALGHLAAGWPDRFGRTVLTTNFDPLVSVAVARAGGRTFRTMLHRDGDIGQSTGEATQVVHLHGYWHGADTLHTPRQLGQARPQLKASLAKLLRDKTVVVVAYGGWDDVFTKALVDVVVEDSSYPEVVWTVRDQAATLRPALVDLLAPGIDRGRVGFYGGVDCHSFLPALADEWRLSGTGSIAIPAALASISKEPTAVSASEQVPKPASPPIIPGDLDQETDGLPPSESARALPSATDVTRARSRRLAAASGQEDRPPEIDVYVGRTGNLATLTNARFRVAYVTGIGGQGKSALAGAFFRSAEVAKRFEHALWRDCKEQSFRFEDHIVSILEALGGDDGVLPADLARQSPQALARLFAKLTVDLQLLIVFDNVDHYVDLERGLLLGAAGDFVSTLLENTSSAVLLFTCRPNIVTDDARVLSHRVEGLKEDEAVELFQRRGAAANRDDVLRARVMTGGHALWLDLVAAQIARRPGSDRVRELLDDIASDGGHIPEATLKSIWSQLVDREQIVLQVLAETVRPTTAIQIADYLGARLRFNRVSKAVSQLRSLNLIVVKRQEETEAYELHPLIRTFVRRTHRKAERLWYIDAILAVYNAMFDLQRPTLSPRTSAKTVRQWLEGAELHVNADRPDAALESLAEINTAAMNEAPVEFARVAGLVFDRDDLAKVAALPHFDSVFPDYVRTLAILNATDEAFDALERYERTLSGKEARYINLCDMRCHLHWWNRNYDAAIKWGSEGVALKKASGVDTVFDSAHNLALAQRDAGMVDPALRYFLAGRSLEDVTEPGTIDEDGSESFYGNIGRCLHFMGQVDPALACYRKSASLAQESRNAYGVENQAFIREWIGELLEAKGEFGDASAFLIAATAKWSRISPDRADMVAAHAERLALTNTAGQHIPDEQTAEQRVVRWIAADLNR